MISENEYTNGYLQNGSAYRVNLQVAPGVSFLLRSSAVLLAMPAVSCAHSTEAYLAFEAESDVKHEYFGPGVVVAMAGASPAHSLIAANTLAELRQQLRPRGCQTHGSDLRVRAGWTYFYPDVVVICEKPQYTEALTRTPPLYRTRGRSPSPLVGSTVRSIR